MPRSSARPVASAPPAIRRAVVVVGVLACLAASLGSTAQASTGRVVRHGDAVADRYIVVLRPTSTRSASDVTAFARRSGGDAIRVFGSSLDGYVTRMSADGAARLAADPDVAFVEQDERVHVDTTQSPADWDLDRIDQATLPLDGSYTYGADGSGVTAYVIDTGIRLTHQEFGGRATTGVDVVDGGSADDCDGHGTHVAGTIGGSTFGVAKGVSLVAVRVLDCSGNGYLSDVIAGVDWVTRDHAAGAPAVANLSLGGSASPALDQAVEASIADGVVYSVAAGNGDASGNAEDACTTSPADAPDAITVSATNSTDTRPSWANVGPCVDMFAPGISVTSAWDTGDTATKTASGTSMAAPHVAGAAAIYLETHPSATPAQVASALKSAATSGAVGNAGAGTPNLLLHVGGTGSPAPTPTPSPSPTPPPPTTSISLSIHAWFSRHGERIRLTWSGAGTATVDVLRNGVLRTTTANDGAYRDRLGWKRGTFSYVVCASETSVCSASRSVRFGR